MKKSNYTGHDIIVPELPDFKDIPVYTGTPAIYSETDIPQGEGRNPLYLALPTELTAEKLKARLKEGNPTYDPALREKPAPERRANATTKIMPCIFPVRRHQALHQHILTAQRGRYCGLDPLDPAFMEKAVRMQSGSRSVGTGAVIADVGMGKTTIILRELASWQQLAEHSDFKGYPLGFNQLLWLFVPCPPKASADGMLRYIAGAMDRVLKTDIVGDLKRERNHAGRQRILSNALNTALVGTIFIDEIQNGVIGTTIEREVFENTLQELINTTFTRFIFVGTPVAYRFRSEALLRRFEGETGQIDWKPFQLDDEWLPFASQLCERQYTSIPTPVTEELKVQLLHLSGGVPHRAKTLWVAAQDFVIGSGDEILSGTLLLHVLQKKFPRQFAKYQRWLRLVALHGRGKKKSDTPNAAPPAPAATEQNPVEVKAT